MSTSSTPSVKKEAWEWTSLHSAAVFLAALIALTFLFIAASPDATDEFRRSDTDYGPAGFIAMLLLFAPWAVAGIMLVIFVVLVVIVGRAGRALALMAGAILIVTVLQLVSMVAPTIPTPLPPAFLLPLGAALMTAGVSALMAAGMHRSLSRIPGASANVSAARQWPLRGRRFLGCLLVAQAILFVLGVARLSSPPLSGMVLDDLTGEPLARTSVKLALRLDYGGRGTWWPVSTNRVRSDNRGRWAAPGWLPLVPSPLALLDGGRASVFILAANPAGYIGSVWWSAPPKGKAVVGGLTFGAFPYSTIVRHTRSGFWRGEITLALRPLDHPLTVPEIPGRPDPAEWCFKQMGGLEDRPLGMREYLVSAEDLLDMATYAQQCDLITEPAVQGLEGARRQLCEDYLTDFKPVATCQAIKVVLRTHCSSHPEQSFCQYIR